MDLSSQHDNAQLVSVNDLIDKEACSLTYVRIDDAIRAICQQGRGAHLCKVAIADAFKQ